MTDTELSISPDELAAEGYRLLSDETGEFAEAALPLAGETWPRWEDSDKADAV